MKAFAVAILLGVSMRGAAQVSILTKRVDSLLKASVPSDGPGCVVLIAQGDRAVYRRAVGMASIELNVQMNARHALGIGSITKQFTAVAVLRLMEQGRLKLTDSIQQYLPGYPATRQAITLEHLLTHTSGIPDFTQIDFGLRNMERWEWQPSEIIDSFKSRPLQFAPGTRYRYSNSGYFLLGYIIERITGIPYQQYVADSLLPLAGLKNTGFQRGDAVRHGSVNGYKIVNGRVAPADYWSPSIGYAAGGLWSGVNDLLTWQRALLRGLLISRRTLAKAWTPFRLSDRSLSQYGYGWYLGFVDGNERVFHGGVTSGFRTEVQYYPAQDAFLVILCNSDQAPKNVLVESISSIVIRHIPKIRPAHTGSGHGN